VYVPPHIGETLIDGFADKQIAEVWINPGAGSAALVARARDRGLNLIQACSIIGIGESPEDY
jgi:hypothetical protein